MKKAIPLFAVLAVSAAAVLTTMNAYAQNNKGPVVGKPVPAFSMTDLAGKKHTDRTLRGKVVLLDFWATWCGPCKAASPTMQKLHQSYSKQGLVVIGANTWEQTKGIKPSQDYAKKHNYTYTFTHGNDNLAESWGIRGIPHFVLIGRDGKVLRVDTGFSPKVGQDMEKAIQAALKAR